MTRWLMTNKRVLTATWLCALLLLQTQSGGTAPTHHLAVSVEGNTPTLIVTSAEIGITPKIMHATRTPMPLHAEIEAGMTTVGVPTTHSLEMQKVSKGRVQKVKGKSHKSVYGKKWHYAAKEREKSKEKTALTSVPTVVAIKPTTVHPGTHRADIASTNAVSSIQNIESTTKTNIKVEDLQANTDVARTSANETGAESNAGSSSVVVDAIIKPKQFDIKPVEQENGSTPAAEVSATIGSLPHSTEVTTKATRNINTEAPPPITTFTSTTVAEVGVATEYNGDFPSPHPRRLNGFGTKETPAAGTTTRRTILAEKVTGTPAFIELHDTTAATATKGTSTASTTTAANASETAATKMPISATTANVPQIAIQIETLPKAITVTTMSPATVATTTAVNIETVTSTLIGTGNGNGRSFSIPIRHEAVKASEMATTTTEFPITERVDVVTKSGLAVSTSSSIVSPAIFRDVIEKSSTSIGDKPVSSAHPPTEGDTDRVDKQTAMEVDSRTPPPRTEMANKETILILTTKTTLSETPSAIPITTATTTTNHSIPTTQSKHTATQNVNPDSGIIFIDDVSDNHEDWRKDDAEKTPAAEEVEMQHDEAIIGRHGDVRNASAHEDTDAAGGGGGTGAEGIIKLIDLEKHDLKAIVKAKQFRGNNKNDTSGEDDGHDGVKKTRKKQLTAKHYLPIAGVSLSAETHFEDLVFGPRNETSADRAHRTSLSEVIHKNHSTVGMSQGDVLSKTILQGEKATQIIGLEGAKLKSEPSHSLHYHQIQKFTTPSPPLKPVHNGYLGPILMEKKRFTVFHDAKKLHQHHETSIETQLREGSLVEILAPTSLLEQSTTQAPGRQLLAGAVSMSTTTPAAPSASPFAFIYPINEQSAPMLSTTVFQVPESMSSTTRLPMGTKHLHTNDTRPEQGRLREQIQQQREFLSTPKFENSERTESKISDIQVEVYDSTVDSIVASTNFKDSEGFYALPLEADADTPAGTTRPPMQPQERFTQYVVDRADYATQESSATPQLNIAAGKPEPAAIEIHINVSEGIGNESEDLEFSYRQPEYGNSRPNSVDELMAKTAKAISMRPITTSTNARQNESNTHVNVERGDEILVVEIIDTGDNITEGSLSAENINPIFTFRSDAESDIELKDIKYLPPEVKVKPPQMSDELFLADLKKENGLPKPPLPPPPPPRKPTIDRDSDTIFYISNTEVKVGESLPTANTNYEQQQQQQEQLRKTRLENQFFPANYLASTHPNSAPPQLRYEEDIILSPVRNTADSLKIFRSQGDGAPPLDVTYVGESVMEVEQSSGAGAGVSTTIATAAFPPGAVSPSQMPDVIIQPAILPEMSIGVPVIGELPPQIELKEIDFMPDEANQQHSGMYENNMLEDNGNGNANGNGNGNGIAIVNSNDVDRLAESSVQYGGDLIDESAGGGGFDGVEGSYPFGNPAVMAHNNKAAHHEAEYAHFTVNHGVNNLRKDELSVDVAAVGSGEVPSGQVNLENGGELKELLARNGNETFPLSMLANGSYAGLASATERMSNATAYSVMEEERNELELLLKNHYTLVVGAFIVLLPVVLTAALTCTMWLVYLKYFGSSNTRNADQTNGNVANGKHGGEHGSTEDESTTDPTISVRPKQPLPSSDANLSNGNCIKVKPNLESHSSVDETNVTKPSSRPASAHNDMDYGISVDDGKAGEVMLLPGNVGAAAAPTSISIPMSSLQKPIDNNKLTTTQANIFANNSVQENFTRPNGSVTKMTLKNNHLIVETEERHDISRVARETKMHYNNSEKDGVFVVEVARGVDSKSIPNSPTSEEPRPIYQTPPAAAAAAAATLRTEDEKVLRNHEEIQIHQPPPETIIQPANGFEEMPERSLHQIIELEEPTVSPHSFRDDSAKKAISNLVRNSNTGLSQSDLSSSSSTDSNKRYSYGNQELYTIEPASYASGSPSTILPLVRPSAPNETEDDDRRSDNGHSLEHSPAAAQGNGVTALGNDGSVCNQEMSNDVKTNEQVITENDVNAAKSNEAELLPANIEETDIVPVNETVSPVEGISVVEKIEEDGKDRLDSDDVEEEENEEETTEINEALNEVAENEDEEIGSVKCINNNNKALENANEAPGQKDAECNQISQTLSDFKDEINSENAQKIDQEVLMSTPAAAPLSFAQPILCNYGYDSIISLPDPPSTEEIKELGEFVGIENNQLDSLPPPSPPPPPIAADMNDNTATENTTTTTTSITVTDTDTAATSTVKTTTNSSATEDAVTATQLILKEILQNNLPDSTPTKYCPTFVTNGNCHGDTTNGNVMENGHSSVAANESNENGHETTNGREVHLELSPNTGGDNNTGTGKVPETQLTPPESPPLSSPIHYDNSVIVSTINGMNGVNRGICGEPLPIAVDVNGS
ncbi:uncharacterized protein LOC101460892 isoform X1 [Ceratitis capitata]|uniref:uncharacterized protein LOC101460892 isoform X1 n=1 Tax=Ceratitis capitata TaxID=7213 RepID=UPI00061887B5|nr:uncharacterized protein LOC101460892 isoform X1 [Ceratitis capitata]